MKRSEAARLGRSHYSTGELCERGHDSERYTSSGGCIACDVARRKSGSRVGKLEFERRQEAVGLRPMTVMVHPDEMELVMTLVESLSAARFENYSRTVMAPMLAADHALRGIPPAADVTANHREATAQYFEQLEAAGIADVKR